MQHQRSVPIILILLLILLAAPAAARLDPRLEWRTIDTEHFLVLFHEGTEEIAARAADIAEEAHRRLAPELRWTPSAKTRLVLADVSDAPNGMATPMPFNRIIVFLSPPLEEPFSLTDREEWLRTVIVHEYTHILHLDTVHRLPAALRGIFGRLYFPNLYQPIWLIEGLATYEETLQTDGGRGRSSYTDMLLRMAVLENRFPELSEAGVFPVSWPGGEVPYLFGTRFYQYLAEKYGPGLPGEISTVYAGQPLPFRVDATAREAFGSTYAREWLLWQQKLRVSYEARREAVSAAGLTPVTRLTDAGYLNLFPALSPDGKHLAYTSRTADRVASLILADADGSNPRPLLRRMVFPAAAGLAWLPDSSGLVYAKIEADRFDNRFADLYRFELASAEETRLTRGLRAGSPDLSPVTGEIVCTAARPEGNRLALVDADGGHQRWLSAEDDRRLFATPRWSPDGERIAVAVKEEGRFTIQILDTQGALLAALPEHGAINASPAWSRDGATLFFTSDFGGIYNIHAWRLASGELFQVTNRLGGAFSPMPTPDGRSLLIADYSAAGFDLGRIDLQPHNWQPLASAAAPAPPLPAKAPPPAPAAAPAYAPWGDLLPRYWFPWFGVDEQGSQVGLLSSGSDAVDRHAWAATVTYGLASERPAYSLLYRYDGLTPTVQAFASDQPLPHADFFRAHGATGAYWERRRSYGVDLLFPSDGLWARHFLVPGLRYEHFAALEAAPPGFLPPDEGRLTGVRLAWLFANSVRPPRAISPEDGRSLSLAVQQSSAALGGDFDQSKYTLDWHEFTTLPWSRHHVLATRLFGGLAHGDVLDQRAFQLGGDSLGDLLQGIDDQSLALRGYPVNALRGQRAVLASAEYRFPLLEVEGGSENGAFFLRRLHGALFAEGGEAFDRGGVDLNELRTAAGAEARCDLDLGYVLPITLRLVVARGFADGGEGQAYLSLWLRF